MDLLNGGERVGYLLKSRVTNVAEARPERRRARYEDLEMIDRTRRALGLLESKRAVHVVFLLASGIRRHARLVDNVPGAVEEGPDRDAAAARAGRPRRPPRLPGDPGAGRVRAARLAV